MSASCLDDFNRRDKAHILVRCFLARFEALDNANAACSSTEELSSPSAQPVGLDTTFKLACTLSDEAPAIHYAALLFQAPSKSYALPIRIRKSSKTNAYTLKLELDLAQAPSDLLALALKSSSRPISLSLNVASFAINAAEEQLRRPFGQISFTEDVRKAAVTDQVAASSKVLPEWEADRYSLREQKEWTFRPQETGKGFLVDVIGSVVVVAPPLILLLALVSPSWSAHATLC